jgi:hypothetical protein
MWAAKRERLYRVYVEYGLTPRQARDALERMEAREAAVRDVVEREAERPHPVPVMPLPDPVVVRATKMPMREPAVRTVTIIDEAGEVPPHVWTSICERVPDPLAPLRGGAGTPVR